ncbi:MAG: glutaredoxin family protein [Dehalococcoidia bacterium]|jgi:glutaredoxin
MGLKHVGGKNAGNIVIYALSTCPWCKKTKKLLDDLGVEYYFEDVDLLQETEKQQMMETVKKWNPACSFPTMVIDDSKCIVGFKEDEIRGALNL